MHNETLDGKKLRMSLTITAFCATAYPEPGLTGLDKPVGDLPVSVVELFKLEFLYELVKRQ